ncbi:dTDP-4-dehydrorhamnose reductase [Polynucleobacter sp. MG-28-Ekke-A2]|uniref:dTDP-4-dehydrorhamnose reductase n=1 Tax=Polynucleobacter sp. MG-28-Ekke-A2 TaxID=3108276 RepID=UPI002B2286CC|nr:dTDP-4-dehydrorhamnose reductase [Polynucleobacter sp. MG-28-Ekke-A2]MEA9601034.1 dTDP-4-dehydrorhamnose reductase [Polynucleobacter sp. MG-28-Ekke-A2]
MNILVFGKDGQLGKAFKALFDELPASANLDITYLGRAECDLSKEEEVLVQLNIAKANLIINASAYTAVDKAETEIDLAYAVNAKAPELMARYAAENNAAFLHYSTDYVFDGSKDGFYIEDDPRNPLGIYGKSKAAGEESIEKVFANSAKGQFAIFRTSWVYGDGGNFIRTMLRLAKEREELKVIHDQHGVPTSADWLAGISLDLALDSAWKLKQFPSGIYHAVPAGETTWHGLATFAVQSALNAGVELKAQPGAIKPILAVEYPLPAPRPMNSRMDSVKLRSAIQDGASKASNSYNQLQNVPNFPAWDGMVQEYVSKLASKGLI